MSARLVILVVVAGALAIYFAVRPKAVPAVGAGQADTADILVLGEKGPIQAVWEQEIDGDEPVEPADLQVSVEVDTSSGRNRLVFTISESHGYYVDTIDLIAWRKGPDVTGPEDSPLEVPNHINNYLKANETLRSCIDLVPAELSHVGGDIGRTEDWDVMVLEYGRARVKNPDPLPLVANDVTGCRN